jgi:alpha-aminoadipic semialdehyde synthase
MTEKKVAIRRETKNKWEKRTPLTPESVTALVQKGLAIEVERSPIRVFPDAEYEATGAKMIDSTNQSDIVIGIKEPPLDTICEGQVHLNFSHTIKGQPYNMPLLKAVLDRGVTLIDYEPMVDEQGNRIAAVFSRYAGMSGTVETLRVAGKKLALQGKQSALESLKQPWEYERLETARQALKAIAPLNEELRILIVGRGNVGQGCRWICEQLDIPELPIEQLLGDSTPAGPWFAVVDAPEITAAKDGSAFDFDTYVKEGTNLYESTFEQLLGKFDILLQGAYWDEKYPRQLPLSLIEKRKEDLPLVIGDISCDIEGTLECTTDATSIDDPAFTFNVETMKPEPGITLSGPTVMSIDNLPCELPADASAEFAELLAGCVEYVAKADLDKPLEDSGLSYELQKGTIVYRGKLTPPFAYMQKFVEELETA